MERRFGLFRRVAAAVLALQVMFMAAPVSAWAAGTGTIVGVKDARPGCYVIGSGRIFDYADGDVSVKVRVSGTARIAGVEYADDIYDVFNADGFDVLVPRGHAGAAEVTMEVERLGEGDAGYDAVMADAGETYDKVYGVAGLAYKFYLDGEELDMSGCAVEVSAGWSDGAVGSALSEFGDDLDAMDAVPEELSLNASAYAVSGGGEPVLASSGAVAPTDMAVFDIGGGGASAVNEPLNVTMSGSKAVAREMSGRGMPDSTGSNGSDGVSNDGTGTGSDSDTKHEADPTTSWIVVDEFGTWLVIGSGMNAKYVVDYYAWLPVIDKKTEGYDAKKNLLVYDTRGENLPSNDKDTVNAAIGLTMVDVETGKDVTDEKGGENGPKRGAKYEIKSNVEFCRIYEDFNSNYLEAPRVVYLDRVSGDPDAESNYELCEIWILEGKEKPDGDGTDVWVKYRKADLKTWDQLPENEQAVLVNAFDQLHFRTDGSLMEIDPKPGSTKDPATHYYIPLKTKSGTQTYIRMVYQPVFCDPDKLGTGGAMFDGSSTQGMKGIKLVPARMYDYDILEAPVDGSDTWRAGRKENEDGGKLIDPWPWLYGKAFVKWATNGRGINDFVANVDGYVADPDLGYDRNTMWPFAFGNDNHGTGLGRVAFGPSSDNHVKLNMTNTAKIKPGREVDPEINGVGTFGLVQDTLGPNGELRFIENIVVPDLFGVLPDNTVKGRTDYPDATLAFTQVGDTYTLYGSQVLGGPVDSGNGSDRAVSTTTGLDKFTYWNTGWTSKWSIYSNNFWPLDGFESSGTDPKFDESVSLEGWRTSSDGMHYSTLAGAASDDGKPHDAFFGMQYDVDFEIDDAYRGPLEYLFFGDDDLWVYLSELDENGGIVTSELVCDVGGVHASIGEYVDLYDYIGTEADKGIPKPGKYRLSMFYLERGSSGSVCWTQFTLPKVTSVRDSEAIERSGSALKIEKRVGSLDTQASGLVYEDMADVAAGAKFKFELSLWKDNEPLKESAIGYVTDAAGNRGDSVVFWENGLYDLSGTGLSPDQLNGMTQEEIKELTKDLDKKTGNIVELGAGDVLTVYGLEKGTTYKVREVPVSGYESRVVVGEIKGSDDGSGSGAGTAGGAVPDVGFDGDGYYTGSVDTTAYLTYVNMPVSVVELPATGGGGAEAWAVAGVSLVALAAAVLFVRRRVRVD